MTKEQIPVRAEIMTTAGLTSPASTAAEPMMIPPTMPMVALTGDGSRTPASRSKSKANSMEMTSTATEKGMLCLVVAIFNAKDVGKSSG